MTGTRPIETYMDDKTLLHLNLQNHDEETLIPDGENLFHIYIKKLLDHNVKRNPDEENPLHGVSICSVRVQLNYLVHKFWSWSGESPFLNIIADDGNPPHWNLIRMKDTHPNKT